jgi:hypothetical protein
MVPSKVMPMIASLEDCTMAVSHERTASSRFSCAGLSGIRPLV